MAQRWFDSLGGERVVVISESMEITVRRELAGS